MNLTPIRDLVKKTHHLDPKKLGNDSFTYVDISSVDKDTKKIVEPQILLVGDAPSRAGKEIKANDVLVATVRPNLNGVAIVPPEFNNQIASTGFCVLRSDTEQLDPNYLFYFTQTGYFISHLTELSTGAGYPAVSDEDILGTRIPLPPLTEQKRIASLLARADRLRQLRRTAHDLSASVLQSVFLEMFGDPVTNSKKLNVEKLEGFTSLVSSGSTPLGGSNVYTASGIRFIRSQNVLMNKFDFSDIAFISEEIYNSMKRTVVKPNDVLLNITGASIGRVACYQDDILANVNQHVCIIRCKPEKLNPIYLSYL